MMSALGRGAVAAVLMVGLLGLVMPYQPTGAEELVPEPFPFSDRYPAEVTIGSAEMLQTLARLQIDVGDVRAADPEDGFPGVRAPLEGLTATVYVGGARDP
jgi:hypothetical protein